MATARGARWFPAALLLAACGGPLSTLDPAGPSSAAIATLWWIMLAGATVLALGMGALLLAAWAGWPRLAQAEPDRLALWGGVVFPLVVLAALVAAALALGERLRPGGGALRVEAEAQQWEWRFAYPEAGLESMNVLHIPAGRDVDVAVTSLDVIHAFWAPRLAGKIDAVPGHVNLVRIHAAEPGLYDGLCAEFCGIGHAGMPFVVEAHPPDLYDARLREAAE